MSEPISYYEHPLSQGVPPRWVSAWGDDSYGPFVEIRIGDARQALRWLPPSVFRMGSPVEEAGRRDNEGPQHWVEITRGFWLFDTPCTQQLWEAVMGENPSRFQHPHRPVEQIDWEQAMEFCERASSRLPNLTLTLPTEAQWELACRADTTTATYAGDLEILGAANAPVLDEIAWYGGNSGVNFDLDEGAKVEWGEKQYEFTNAGTRVVAQKQPNAWGLYDMLGNVWEWCRDGERPYEGGAVRDPVGPLEASGYRVNRGGGWYNSARDVRAAYRYASTPSGRVAVLGLRCCSSGEPS